MVLGGSIALGAPAALGGEAAAATAAGRATGPAVAGFPTPLLEAAALRVRPAQPQPVSERVEPHLLVRVPHDMSITSRPGGGRIVGTMPAGSKYYRIPIVAWVEEVSRHGRYGLVTVPYSGTGATGWIPLKGLERELTQITVRMDLSRHEIVVERRAKAILRLPAATGAPASPTPPGRYFVTDRIPFAPGGTLGSFAFGISGIQTRLPAGWNGGDQLAIHGTNDPSSIGTSASAGCLRISEKALDRLKPLLQLGTPVIITR